MNSNNKALNLTYKTSKNNQDGVTLLLSILVLSSILAISFSLATILFVEIRTSGDLVRTEPAIYGATGMSEEALFKIKRQVTGFDYTTKLGDVRSTSTESTLTDPAQIIRVPAGSNTFDNTAISYPIYSDVFSPASGYSRLDISYPPQAAASGIEVYICEFDVNYTGTYYSPGPVCSNTNQNNSYWAPTLSISGVVPYVLTPGVTKTVLLDSNKQQQLILVNPTGVTDVYIRLTTYDQFGVSKGLPYFAQTAVEITSRDAGVSRRLKLVTPNPASATPTPTPGPTPPPSSNISSVNLNGSGDLVLVNHQASLSLAGNFTVEAWVYPRSQDGDYQPIVVKENSSGGNRNYAIFISPNSMKVHYSFQAPCGTWHSFDSTGSLSEDDWNHVAMTYNGSIVVLYIDGVADSTQSVTGGPCTNTNPVRIGGESGIFSDFDGLIDEIRIWNVARNGSQIASSKNLELAGNETGLVGYWKFNENSGDTGSNSVSGGNDADLSGPGWSTNIPF